MTFKESDVVRDGRGQFAEKAGGGKSAVGGNASFFAKFSKKIGATDDKATAKAKLAQTWSPDAPKKTGAFDAIKIASKAAPPAVAPAKKAAPEKVAASSIVPTKLPAKKAVAKKTPAKKAAPAPAAPAVSAGGKGFKQLTPAQAAAMQRQMLKGDPWTPAQRGGLRTYTGESYTTINGALRKGKATEKTKATIRNARAGMRGTTDDVEVYRGMGSGTAFGFIKNRKLTKADVEALVGKGYHDPGFTSTATGDGGYGHGQRVRARIKVPKGTRGAFVEGLTQNKGENEFVLDAGTHYRITGYEFVNGKVVLDMEVVKQDV